MKLPVVQIISGILIIFITVFTMVWYFPGLVSEIPVEITSEVERLSVDIKTAKADHINSNWDIIYGWMVAVILLGLLVVGTGIVQQRKQKAGNKNMRLAIIQTVLGVFITAIALAAPVFYEPILFPDKLTLSNGSHGMGSYSIKHIRIFIAWFISLLITGCVIFSCGIAGILHLKREKVINMDKTEAKDIIRMERI